MKKTVTMDLSEYNQIVERLELAEKTLSDRNQIYSISLDFDAWNYKIMTKTDCIDNYIKCVSVKDFKSHKKELSNQ